MADADIAVVIPAHNAARTIASTLAAVYTQVLDARDRGVAIEVVVVDDASTDGTAAEARSAGRHGTRVVARTRRGGPNAARNDGVAATSAPLIVFLDGDDRPLPGSITSLAAAVIGDDVIAGGTYVMRTPGRRWTQSLASTRMAFGYPYAVGGALATSRALLERVGGFDASLQRGGTDLAFCIDAQRKAGARIVTVDDARVLHSVPLTVVGRARVHFARERGHRALLRRLATDGRLTPARTPSAQNWPERARSAGGWPLLAAEVAGRAAGRVWFG